MGSEMCIRDSYVPLYVEIAKREGVGPEFRDMLIEMIAEAKGKSIDIDDLR